MVSSICGPKRSQQQLGTATGKATATANKQQQQRPKIAQNWLQNSSQIAPDGEKLRPRFGPQLGTSKTRTHKVQMGPILEPFLALRRSWAALNNVFLAPKASKTAPRGKKEAFSSHRARKLQSEANLYRF